jgi:hypothetical protein
MWDLTVSDVHTFAVGEGEWVVHNCGFSSFGRAKTALGPTGRGYVYDHIVEQSQITLSGFEPQLIHSAANLRRVPAEINNLKAAIYNSIRPDLTAGSSLRVRNWLAGQPFEAQRNFGLSILRELLGG